MFVTHLYKRLHIHTCQPVLVIRNTRIHLVAPLLSFGFGWCTEPRLLHGKPVNFEETLWLNMLT